LVYKAKFDHFPAVVESSVDLQAYVYPRCTRPFIPNLVPIELIWRDGVDYDRKREDPDSVDFKMTFAKSTTFEYTISSATCWWSWLSSAYFKKDELRQRCGAISYTMTREDGSALPSWIEFDDQILEPEEDNLHLRKLVFNSSFMPKDEPTQFTLVLTLSFAAPRYEYEPTFLEKNIFRVNVLSEEVCATNSPPSIVDFLATETFTMTGAEDITKEFVPQDDDLSDKPTVRLNRNFSTKS